MKRLAWCSLVAGFATLYQCGGSGNVGIGNPDGGAADGSAGDTGAASSSGAGGKDGSAAADGSSGGGKEGGTSEGGSSGGEGGAVEGGGGEGGASEGGAGESGAGDGGPGADGGDGGGVIEGGTDASDGGTDASDGGTDASDGGTDASDGGTVAHARFRVAEVMPSVAAYDFCWQQSGGAWNGPVMLGFGISARLAYEQVSEYVPIPVASTTVRIVAAAATDCTTSFADVTLGPAAASDSYLVAAFVQGNAAPQAKAFVDEGAANGTTNDRIRLIDAAFTSAVSGGGGGGAASIDLYVGGTASTASLFDDVPFGGVAPPTLSVDANGYLSHDAFKAADVRIRLHAGLDLLDDAAFTTTAAHVYSFFTVGVHDILPANTTPMRLLVCDDSAAPVGHLGVCSAGGTQL